MWGLRPELKLRVQLRQHVFVVLFRILRGFLSPDRWWWWKLAFRMLQTHAPCWRFHALAEHWNKKSTYWCARGNLWCLIPRSHLGLAARGRALCAQSWSRNARAALYIVFDNQVIARCGGNYLYIQCIKDRNSLSSIFECIATSTSDLQQDRAQLYQKSPTQNTDLFCAVQRHMARWSEFAGFLGLTAMEFTYVREERIPSTKNCLCSGWVWCESTRSTAKENVGAQNLDALMLIEKTKRMKSRSAWTNTATGLSVNLVSNRTNSIPWMRS